MHKSQYHIPFADWRLNFPFAIWALLGLNGLNLISESLFTATAMCTWFLFWLRYWLVALLTFFLSGRVFGAVQSLPKYPILWQLKHLSSLVAFLFIPFQLLLDIMARFSVIPVDYLLTNFALVDTRICFILLIILSPYSSIIVVVNLKSLCKESKATAIAILSHISRFSIITARSCFIKNWTSVKIFITSFSKLLGLLIWG